MKPVVFYVGMVSYHPRGDAEVARVFCPDHPKLGKNVDVRTSRVLKKFSGGFETLNTVYIQSERAYD
jgi:hypothetical protein